MTTFNEDRFDECLNQLMETVIRKQAEKDYGTTAVSFTEGFIEAEEGYKRIIYAESQNIMNIESWTPEMIGSGEIKNRIIAVMKQKMPDTNEQQNLLDWREIEDVEVYFNTHLHESEKLLYGFYKNDFEDQLVFESLEELWGKRLPIIAFLFFIKDDKKYMPLRPSHFKNRFERIGITTDNTLSCSWDNYQDFLDIIKEVQDRLTEKLNDDIELIDAHSFIWMMWLIDDTEPNKEVGELLGENDNESVVLKPDEEGMKKQYYVTRYERSGKNRRLAIKAHGYKCMACGFDFEEKYGELGKEFIEVHHVVPLSSRTEVVNVNPETDLICLCANCHRMVHRKKNYVPDLEELKAIIGAQKRIDMTQE